MMMRQTRAIEQLTEAINGMIGAFLSDAHAPDDAEDIIPPKPPYLHPDDA